MTLYADLCYEQSKFTVKGNIGACISQLYSRIDFINGDFISGLYCINISSATFASFISGFPQQTTSMTLPRNYHSSEFSSDEAASIDEMAHIGGDSMGRHSDEEEQVRDNNARKSQLCTYSTL